MKIILRLLIFSCCVIVSARAFSQASTPSIDVALLEAPTVHDCSGKVRVTVKNCACGTSADGVWNLSYGAAPGYTGPASSGSRHYATCDELINDDVDILPGNYIFTASILPDPNGCHDLNQTLSFSINVPNGACIAPGLEITNVTNETGNGCNNGVISVLGILTQCSSIGMGFQLYDSADNLIAETEGNIFGAGMDKNFDRLRAGSYTVKAFQGGGRTPCADNVLIERGVVVGRNPVLRSGDAELRTVTGDGGCQKHSIVCGYNDDYNSKTCTGPGPETWQAQITGETNNGQQINIQLSGVFGQSVKAENMPGGIYEVICGRSVPGPFDGNVTTTVTVPDNACSSTLTEVSRTTNNGKGIGCDSAAVIEFSFNSNACYQEWTLYQPDIIGMGETGTWTAVRGQNIRVSLPGSFDGTSYSYQFFATHDADPLLDCVARTNVSGVPSLGCDATVTATKTKEVSVPGASDAVYTFTLNTSSCLDAPWFVVMKNSTTSTEYGGSADSKKDSIIIDSLPEGNYTWSFRFAGASGCGSPNAGGGGLDCNNPVTVYQDNDGDGFGNAAVSATACFYTSLGGYVGNNTDSNDDLITYPDNDGDGFGAGSPAPSGVPNDDDPNDNNADIYPNALEICDGFDNNQDGIVDSAYMNGLVLYLPMNGDAIDKSPNALNGTIIGTVVAGADRFGNLSGAMVFNGNQNNHIRINDNPLLRPSSITLSAWVYIAAQRSPSTFINKSLNCNNHSWQFGTEGSSYSTWVGNSANCGDFIKLESPYTERVWKHIVYTLDDIADTRKLYVDGVEVASGTYTSYIPYEASPVLIGAAMWGGTALDFPFIGSLDDVMIFNRAISAGEVNTLFTNGSPLIATSKVYYADADGDGFGNRLVTTTGACGNAAPSGYVSNSNDCDDTRANINPNVSAGTVTGVTTLCAGSSSTFTASGTQGGTWISRNTNVATVSTTGVVTAVANGTTRVVYMLNNCTPEGKGDSLLLTVASQYVWTGAGVNSNWNNPANWTTCGVPVSGADVTINDVTNKPSLNTDVTTGALTLNSNASIILNDKTLTINGAVTGTGTLSSSLASSLIITGNTGTIKFTAGKDTIKNITLQQNASATIGNMLYVKAGTQPGVITLQQGATLIANGNLTLLSDINGTARVAQIPVNAAGTALAGINGDVVMERFIPRNTYKAWHMLSVPTKGTQTIKQAWQENQNPNVVGTSGYGTTISTAAGYLQNGFDGVTTKTSMQFFNPANGGLLNITSTNIPSETTNGYFLFVRGDRSVPMNASNVAVNATRLRTKGTLYTGNQAALIGEANRNLMVGNIYPSAIDFTLLPKTGGIGNTFYIWDPKLNNGTTLGAYQTFSATNGYTPIVAGGSYSGPNTRIESGQSFFVYAAGTAGTIQMVEAAKISGANRNVFRPLARQAEITVTLRSNINGALYIADANTIAFDSWFTDDTNGNDAHKLMNPGENIASGNNYELFAIEARGNIAEQEFVQYHISNLRPQAYQLQFDFKSVAEQGREVYLEDSYLKTSTLLDCSNTIIHSFTVTVDVASRSATRFRLVFGKKRLPVANNNEEAESYISVNPNPVNAGHFSLNLFGFEKGVCWFKLLDQKGAVVYAYKLNVASGNSSNRIMLTNKPAAGLYTVELLDEKQKKFTTRIIFR